MSLQDVCLIIAYIMKTLKNGEIRLSVRNGEIRHVNRTEEVFARDIQEF